LLGSSFTLAVSFSQPYLGVHYPTAIIGAWAISLAWVTALRLGFLGIFPSDRSWNEDPLA